VAASEWVAERRDELEPRSIETLEWALSHVLEHLAGYSSSAITAAMVDSYKRAKLHVGSLSKRSINKTIAVLGQALDDVLVDGTPKPARGKKRRLEAGKAERIWLELDEPFPARRGGRSPRLARDDGGGWPKGRRGVQPPLAGRRPRPPGACTSRSPRLPPADARSTSLPTCSGSSRCIGHARGDRSRRSSSSRLATAPSATGTTSVAGCSSPSSSARTRRGRRPSSDRSRPSRTTRSGGPSPPCSTRRALRRPTSWGRWDTSRPRSRSRSTPR
jgi:hypothetical protein